MSASDISDRVYAATMLDTSALGYSAAVTGPREASPEVHHELWVGSRAALQRAALEYAAKQGSLDAAERAELIALRRFRDGMIGLRQELATGEAVDVFGKVSDLTTHAIETIDAMLQFDGGGAPKAGG